MKTHGCERSKLKETYGLVLAEKKMEVVNDKWKHIIISDESQIIIGQYNRVYVWRSAHGAYHPESMSAESCKPKVSVMIWG